MRYELIDHTADVGIHVFGTDLEDLFATAAHALSHIIADADAPGGFEEHHIRIGGDDWPDLMVNWLREILFFWTGRELLIQHAEISSLCEYELTARIKAAPYDPDRHFIKNEIKAVTYHDIRVWESEDGWEAKVVFDV